MLKVHEVFKSIQGEGIDIGLPTIFVRFAGCNLKCKWCDTQYASREGSKHKNLALMQVLQLVENEGVCGSVTLTGGEPFIQELEDIDFLIYELKGKGYHINIETNGVVLPELKYGNLVDRFSVSPKLPGSGSQEAIKIKTLQKYVEKYSHKLTLKFVINDKFDYFKMFSVLNELKDFAEKNIPVVVQPNIDDKIVSSIDKQNEKFLELMDLTLTGFSRQVKHYNIRIIPQFHKYLWNDKRGV